MKLFINFVFTAQRVYLHGNRAQVHVKVDVTRSSDIINLTENILKKHMMGYVDEVLRVKKQIKKIECGQFSSRVLLRKKERLNYALESLGLPLTTN